MASRYCRSCGRPLPHELMTQGICTTCFIRSYKADHSIEPGQRIDLEDIEGIPLSDPSSTKTGVLIFCLILVAVYVSLIAAGN